MKRDNGAILTIGILTAFAAAAEGYRRRKGSSNEDDVESQLVFGQIVDEPRGSSPGYGLESRHAAQARAQAGLPDAELARRAYFGGDLLEGLTFDEAANIDPRRIDGLMTQQIAPLFGEAPGMIGDLYAHMASDVRRIGGGRMKASTLAGLMLRNDVLVARLAAMPRAALRDLLPELRERAGRAADIARRAARAAQAPEDRDAWMEFFEYYSQVPSRVEQALSPRLAGPGRRRALAD